MAILNSIWHYMKNVFRISGVLLLIHSFMLINSCKKSNDSTIKDGDGNVYSSIKIGTQEWLLENLKTTKYRNGDLISSVYPATTDISGESTPKYQWPYNGDIPNATVFGRLYTWYAATDSRNICPTGWHVPSDADWDTLTTYLGGESLAGGKLKETGTTHWTTPNTGADNSSEFTAIPGGYRYSNGTFLNTGNYGIWWTSTGSDNTALYRIVSYNYNAVVRGYSMENFAFSVRCVKDN